MTMMSVGEKETLNQTSFENRQRQIDAEKKAEQEQNEKAKQDAKKCTYDDWAQLNRQNIIHLIKAAQVNPTALQILLFIIEHMNRMNALICSYKVFEEQLGMSRATVTRSIKYLKENGFMYIYKSGTSNVYVVSDKLVWTSHGNKTKYCKFPAEVVLSASEQDEIDNDRKLKFDYSKIIQEQDTDNS